MWWQLQYFMLKFCVLICPTASTKGTGHHNFLIIILYNNNLPWQLHEWWNFIECLYVCIISYKTTRRDYVAKTCTWRAGFGPSSRWRTTLYPAPCIEGFDEASWSIKFHHATMRQRFSIFIRKSNNCPKNHWFFHETWWFFEGFGMSGISNSLVVIFSDTWNWQFSDSEIYKGTETDGYYENLIPTQHWIRSRGAFNKEYHRVRSGLGGHKVTLLYLSL